MSKKTCFLWENNTAIDRIKKNPKKLALSSVIDILFFIVYGFLTAPLFRKLVEYIVIIGTEISQNAASMVRGENPTVGSLIANDSQLTQYFHKLLLVYLILAVVIYLVYVFFHSITWKISSEISGRKIGMYDYLKDFALVNIFWVILFIVYHFVSLYFDLNEAAIRSVQAEPSSFFRIALAVLILFTFYFAAISYALIGKVKKGKIRKSFKIGFKNFRNVLPAYLVVLLVFLILRYILNAVGDYNFVLMIIVGVVTLIPAMTWARVYFTMVVEKNVHT